MQMAEPMSVFAEVWPVAADAAGIWLVTGDRLISDAVGSDNDPWDEGKALLNRHEVTDLGSLVYFHGTSNRPDRGKWIVAHVAVVEGGESVRARFPHALPITSDLMDYVGKPFPHGPTTAPIPRDIDVLLHACAHLSYLVGTNSDFRAALIAAGSGGDWLRELSRIEARLAEMYRTDWDTLERIPA
jgi:hypothetical protein